MIELSDITKIKCWRCVGRIFRDSPRVIMAKSCFLIYPASVFYPPVFSISGYMTKFGLDEEVMRDMRKAKTHESFIQGEGRFNSSVISVAVFFFFCLLCEGFISITCKYLRPSIYLQQGNKVNIK